MSVQSRRNAGEPTNCTESYEWTMARWWHFVRVTLSHIRTFCSTLRKRLWPIKPRTHTHTSYTQTRTQPLHVYSCMHAYPLAAWHTSSLIAYILHIIFLGDFFVMQNTQTREWQRWNAHFGLPIWDYQQYIYQRCETVKWYTVYAHVKIYETSGKRSTASFCWKKRTNDERRTGEYTIKIINY